MTLTTLENFKFVNFKKSKRKRKKLSFSLSSSTKNPITTTNPIRQSQNNLNLNNPPSKTRLKMPSTTTYGELLDSHNNRYSHVIPEYYETMRGLNDENQHQHPNHNPNPSNTSYNNYGLSINNNSSSNHHDQHNSHYAQNTNNNNKKYKLLSNNSSHDNLNKRSQENIAEIDEISKKSGFNNINKVNKKSKNSGKKKNSERKISNNYDQEALYVPKKLKKNDRSCYRCLGECMAWTTILTFVTLIGLGFLGVNFLHFWHKSPPCSLRTVEE